MHTRDRKRRFEIIFRDEHLIVVDKPSGLLSIPDRYQPDLPNVTSMLRVDNEPAIPLHRLDKDTSGLMLLACGHEAHQYLSKQFEQRTVEKTYCAIVLGPVRQPSFVVDYPLRPNGDRKHRTVVDHGRGKPSETGIRLVQKIRKFAVVEAQPKTGRTHQVRVHLASVGMPIVCDTLYGGPPPIFLSHHKRKYTPGKREERPLIGRLALHASTLSFQHPGTSETMTFSSDLPKDMSATIKQLAKLEST